MAADLEPAGAQTPEAVIDDRWRTVWIRRCRGESFADIAKTMGVATSTVATWYKRFAEIERAKQADFEVEKVSLVGRFEQAALDSWQAFERCDDSHKAKPEHMANVLRALQMSARLRGMDVVSRGTNVLVKETESEVVIRVGGQEMVRRRISQAPGPIDANAVQVPSREIPSRRRAADGEGAAEAGEGADRD